MSDGAKLHGQQYDPATGLVFQFVQQSKGYTGADTARVTGLEGNDGVDIDPLDRSGAQCRTYDLEAITAALEAEVLTFVEPVVLDWLPDVLEEVKVFFNKSEGEGVSNFPANQQGFVIVGSGSGSLNPRASAQGSASIVPQVAWTMNTSFRTRRVDATIYVFYIVADTVTKTDVVNRVSAILASPVTAIPIFKAKNHQVILKGQQASVRASAATNVSISLSTAGTTSAYDWGNEYSKEGGVSISRENIPLCIHGAITLAGGGADSATVTVQANADALDSAIDDAPPALPNDTGNVTGTANANVLFENGTITIAATTPDTVPITGVYLVEHRCTREDFGAVLVRATVVDFSQYA